MKLRFLANARMMICAICLASLTGCHEATVSHEANTGAANLLVANTLSVDSATTSVSKSPLSSRQVKRKSTTDRKPVAVFEETDYSFGEMDPYTFGDHSFKVTNKGTAPLVLELGESTCHCTVSEVPQVPILPGESTQILLRWQTSKNNKYFSESSTIRTNDPASRVVSLRVRGHVRVHFGASPSRFQFTRIRPGETASRTALLSSQVWPSFEIVDVRSSMPGIKWEVAAPPALALEDIKAKSGMHLTVTVPNYLEQGSFTHWLRIKIRPEGAEQPTEYELPLIGKVVRPVSVYGKNIDQTGTIRFGVVSSHVGLNQKFMVKVRDKQTALMVNKIHTIPEFLDVQLHTQDAAAGLYIMAVNIPAGSKPCDFISKSGGLIRLDFEHPRIDSLELKMEFAVADRPPTR